MFGFFLQMLMALIVGSGRARWMYRHDRDKDK